ncbi:hypothetical protein [Streptomyces spectabilis]|uniref:hypothetical protein n=1 Tax=Streptomyces spectabilis TaxID=68270 RepID=UPI0033D9C822
MTTHACIQLWWAADQADCVRIIHALLDETWAEGEVFPATAALVPLLCATLRPPITWLHPKVTLILGLFTEGIAPDPSTARAVHAAVESGLDAYLAMARMPHRRAELDLALVYLLAHFPQHRARIEAVWTTRHTDPDNTARLARCLTTPDFDDPATLRLIGRSWPTPRYWQSPLEPAVTGKEERRIRDLPPDALALIWDQETQALLAYLGAQAEHAIKEASSVR